MALSRLSGALSRPSRALPYPAVGWCCQTRRVFRQDNSICRFASFVALCKGESGVSLKVPKLPVLAGAFYVQGFPGDPPYRLHGWNSEEVSKKR